jgi:hypothetical protein
MERKLQKMIDRTEIIETINRLFIGTDNRDWERVKSCFAPKVLFDMSSLSGNAPEEVTPDAIAAAWESGLRPLQAVHHQAGNYLADIDGATAEAFCYATATHYLPNSSGRNTRTFVGSYDIGLSRENGRWRISKFRFNLKYIDGNPDLEHS